MANKHCNYQNSDVNKLLDKYVSVEQKRKKASEELKKAREELKEFAEKFAVIEEYKIEKTDTGLCALPVIQIPKGFVLTKPGNNVAFVLNELFSIDFIQEVTTDNEQGIQVRSDVEPIYSYCIDKDFFEWKEKIIFYSYIEIEVIISYKGEKISYFFPRATSSKHFIEYMVANKTKYTKQINDLKGTV